jgi:hypothetical protein
MVKLHVKKAIKGAVELTWIAIFQAVLPATFKALLGSGIDNKVLWTKHA